jgi:hypothetical protein
MSSRELTEWMAFDLVEPIGGKRGDIQAAVVASTIANVNRGRSTRPYEVQDFIIEYHAPDQTTNDTSSLLGMLGMYGGGNEGGEAAQEDHNPDLDDDAERLRGAGDGADNPQDGVGGVDSPAGGDA